MCKVVSQVSLDPMRLTLDTTGERGAAANHRQGRNDCYPLLSPSYSVITKQWLVLTRLCFDFDRLAVRQSLSYLRLKGTGVTLHRNSLLMEHSAWYYSRRALAHYQTLIIVFLVRFR